MKVKRRTGEGSLELIALVVAIILGIAFGVFYGQEMWLASGGAKKKLVELQTVEEQKQAIIVAETTKAEQLTEEIRSLQSEENPNEDEINAKQSEKEKSLAEAKRITDDHLPKINAEAERLTLVAEEAEKATKEGTNAFAYYSYILSDFAGDIFIQILKMLVIPLVVTSMICGMTSLGDIRKLGRIGGITITYYLTTGAVAVLIGIVLVQVIQPGGQPVDDTFAFINENVASKQGATISETILNVFRGRGDPSSG
ncbi:MAG: cation:dicarboxylase symporter family transporter, partial [Pirellulaceae bacterium]|nr:cation:dicarboxylase symporter family transporter [Pirellulaceae bacterium]